MSLRGAVVVLLLLHTSCATAPAAVARHGGAAEPPPGTFHVVQPGETVWDLARQTGLSVEEIVEVNGLPSADEVAAGQLLYLPAGAAPVVDVPAPAERIDAPQPAGAGELTWPLDGVVLRWFGAAKGPTPAHDGLLIAAPSGTAVRAAQRGTVAFAGDQGSGLGTLVVLRHDGDLVTIYGHLASVDVAVGAVVQAGDRLGACGQSGGAETPRLWFQVRRGRAPVDPRPLLPP